MIVILIAAAAVTAGEPVFLQSGDAHHHWRPRAAQVAWVEQHLVVPERMGGPLANFDRYYAGVYREGHRVMTVELVNLIKRPAGSGAVHVVAPGKVPAIGDGGCGVIHFSYDEISRTASSLDCNFALPVPPHP